MVCHGAAQGVGIERKSGIDRGRACISCGSKVDDSSQGNRGVAPDRDTATHARNVTPGAVEDLQRAAAVEIDGSGIIIGLTGKLQHIAGSYKINIERSAAIEITREFIRARYV